MIAEVRDALANLQTDFPGYSGQGTSSRVSSGGTAGTTASIRSERCPSMRRIS